MRAPLIVMGITFLFIGAIFLSIGGSPLIEDRRYHQRGTRVDAVAINKTLHHATDDSSTRYEITYLFQLPHGEAYEKSEPVPVHVWERIDAGSRLTVEFLRGEPSSARAIGDAADRQAFAPWLLIGAVLVLGGLIAINRAFRQAPAGTRSAPPEPVVAQEPSFWPLARRSFGFWFGGIFLAVGLSTFLASASLLYQHLMFARDARVAQGVVLTKEIKRSGKQNRTKRYETTYRYTVAGHTFEGRDDVSFDEWKALRERGQSGVLYRPQRPASSRLAGARPWLAKTLFVLIGAVFTGIGGTFFISAIRHARLEWRLRHSGVSAPGTVVELRERNLKIDGVQQWRLHYQFRDFRGQAHNKTIDVSEDEAQQLRVGDAGKVLYDPARPTDALWLGRS